MQTGSTSDPEPAPLPCTYEELAGMIDHSLLHPALTDADVEAGCRLALRYGVAAVCVRPCDVRRAAELLRGTPVRVAAVVGFPHGSSLTEVKHLETVLACRDGAQEIDMVLNIGKARSGDWEYVRRDIAAVCEAAHAHGARVKVILEMALLDAGGAGRDGPALKRKLCELAEAAGADWIKTSTGFAFLPQPDGTYRPGGATDEDLKLMRETCSARVQIKAAGGVRTLDRLLRVRELGASRCGATATAQILDEYCRRAGRAHPFASPPAA
ncbi:MAG: deoxyribose-phosphate aldolase [Limisphaera sp.]|nr:deoxyribose-phosphate aldolase [Limisphaera sp.]